ncbi:hypothetical protein V1292_004849 [Bradyrhizobium sp. AZCC 1719]|uniref:DUF2806 domain-containing protein n=1 Tax=Bradyrhizobium sp. AZCC 1719 TaxID=3117028 RepID=UPI002FF3D66B
MSDEDKPSEKSGTLEVVKQVIGDINLPKLIAGPAGDAISRLIAGGADIPAAWLEQKAKSIRDKTAAQSQIAKTLADAASELVKNDPGLVQRAADAFLAKELRHQHNRETIAVKAIEQLKETSDAETTKPDDDWLNMFARHAQEASSERLQDMWARVLAGQLRKPHSFSLQTLRFISELDEQIAALFDKWSVRVIGAELIAFPETHGDNFTELLALEEYGLVTGVTGNLSRQFREKKDVPAAPILRWAFPFKDHVLLVDIRQQATVEVPIVLLTRIGRELFSVTRTPGTIEPVKAFADQFPKENVERLMLLTKALPNTEPEVLWRKPGEAAG